MQAIQENKKSWLDKTFKLSENNTSVKTEVIAGITTFMTMAYILVVNANIYRKLCNGTFSKLSNSFSSGNGT